MIRNRYFNVILLLLVITAALVLIVVKREEPIVVETNLEKLPKLIAGYKGIEDNFPQGVYDELDADLHVYRHYHSTDGTKLSFYLGYYGTAKGGRTAHNPFGCLPAVGWGILYRGTVAVATSYYPDGVDVNYIVAGKGDRYNVMLHWYQSAASKVLSTGFQQNIERFKGRFLHNRNDGAYIQVSSVCAKDEIEPVKDAATRFVKEIMELLPDYWPKEK